MTKALSKNLQPEGETSGAAPSLNIQKLGIVSRNYTTTFENDQRDFSHSMCDVLIALDAKNCDAVLFSLYSIDVNSKFSTLEILQSTKLKNIKAIFLEEFKDGEPREAVNFVVYYLIDREWTTYDFSQRFGTTTGRPRKDIDDFVKQEMPKRILGNSCVLLCGETNIVKYSKKIDQKIHDVYGVLEQIPNGVKIILNPIHDKMTRFEMKLKREFLSRNNRVVISVWNKGRIDKNGKTRDGDKPAWTVYRDGELVDIAPLPNNFGLEIGIVNAI